MLVTKNHRVHTLPLSDHLVELLSRRKSKAVSTYVFPGKRPGTHLTDTTMAIDKVRQLSGQHFTLHDLRRTFITLAESCDFSGYTLKRLLNHRDPNDATEGYIVLDIERLRKPRQAITIKILSLTRLPPTENVVPLTKHQ